MRSRTLVRVSGWLFLLVGLAIILHLHAPIAVKVILAAAWVADTLREFRAQALGHRRVSRLLLHPREPPLSRDLRGKEHALQILKGSVVLRHWAWLRLGFDDGLHYVELFVSNDCRSSTWRRLQLFWRHAL